MAQSYNPDSCYGCWDRTGYNHRHSSYFIDTRTDRRFCGECTAALISFEMDQRSEVAEDPDLAHYKEWADPEDALPGEEGWVA